MAGPSRAPGPLRRAAWVVVTAAVTTSAGCSDLFDNTAFTPCAGDADCPTGEQCNIQLGGLCEPEPVGLPPRAVLGFVVDDPVLGEEVELLACDPEVSAGTTELSVLRSDLFQTLSVSYEETVEATSGVCPSGYEPRRDDPSVCSSQFPADVGLSQPSRLGRLTITTSATLTLDPGGDTMASNVEVVWPRSFGSPDELPFTLAVTDTRDDNDPDEFARPPIRSVVHRDTPGATPSKLDLLVTSRKRCHRRLTGAVRPFMGANTTDEYRVELLYDEPVAATNSVLPAGTSGVCVGDDDCGPGEACNASSGLCGIDLRGVVAGATVAEGQQSFAAYVYSHCEEDAQPSSLSLQSRYGPLGGSPSGPTMYADFMQPLEIGSIGDPLPKTDPLPDDLCLPPWPAPSAVAFELVAPPVTVIEGATPDTTWTCCTIGDCFPGEGPYEDQAPGDPPDRCGGFSTMTLTSDLMEDQFGLDEAAWVADGCLPLSPREDGTIGRHTVTVTALDAESPPPSDASYCVDGACQALLSASLSAPRTYALSIEQPVGALSRSESFEISLGGSEPPQTSFELRPRTILQGQVTCASNLNECQTAGATVVAERLRVAGEDTATVLRPYVYSQTSRADGTFFLPVNPGVYVLTTLPPAGQVGGPADLTIIDAREGSPEVTVSATGTPFVSVSRGTQLLVGHTVRLRLNKFGSGARVLPYDLGSWRSQPDWPKDAEGAPLFDLNLPDTCYSGSQRGCVIRQVNAGIRPLATSRAEFTVRSRGSSDCP